MRQANDHRESGVVVAPRMLWLWTPWGQSDGQLIRPYNNLLAPLAIVWPRPGRAPLEGPHAEPSRKCGDPSVGHKTLKVSRPIWGPERQPGCVHVAPVGAGGWQV